MRTLHGARLHADRTVHDQRHHLLRQILHLHTRALDHHAAHAPVRTLHSHPNHLFRCMNGGVPPSTPSPLEKPKNLFVRNHDEPPDGGVPLGDVGVGERVDDWDFHTKP